MADPKPLTDAYSALPAAYRVGLRRQASAIRQRCSAEGSTAEAAFWSALMCFLYDVDDENTAAFRQITAELCDDERTGK